MEYVIIVSIVGILCYASYVAGYRAGLAKGHNDYVKLINLKNDEYNKIRDQQDKVANDIDDVDDVDKLFQANRKI